MLYQFNEYAANAGMMLIPLDTALRELHAFIGNADTEGYTVFPSFGATQGVEVALYAISQQICQEHKIEKADVFAQ
jgi:predicted phage gp36 major capsid-like protein